MSIQALFNENNQRKLCDLLREGGPDAIINEIGNHYWLYQANPMPNENLVDLFNVLISIGVVEGDDYATSDIEIAEPELYCEVYKGDPLNYYCPGTEQVVIKNGLIGPSQMVHDWAYFAIKVKTDLEDDGYYFFHEKILFRSMGNGVAVSVSYCHSTRSITNMDGAVGKKARLLELYRGW